MRLPRQRYSFFGDLSCAPATVADRVWQEHVVKHPLGVGALRAKSPNGITRTWNDEGWDVVTPPVATLEARRWATAAIRSLDESNQRCGVDRLEKETYGGREATGPLPCRVCPDSLVARCFGILNDSAESIGGRYAEATEALLSLVATPDGDEIPRARLIQALHRNHRDDESRETLAVLTVGDGIVRIHGGHGVRAEFYLNENQMRWRTTYRRPYRTPATQISGLLDFASSSDRSRRPGLASETCLVPRPWSERYVVEERG